MKIVLSDSKKKWITNFSFAGVLLILFFLYGLNRTFFEPPQSVHVWRQTNSLSLTQNYAQDNFPFFKPEMHNQFCDDGTSGKAVGEFPIIYYMVAQLWKLLGNHIWIFRMVQIIIVFAGLWCLFQVMYQLCKNWFWSAFASLLLFTSPMMVFYGPNFLPDAPGLALVFVGWYFIFKYLKNRKILQIWLAALFFSLSVLLKITSALSIIALLAWVVFELLFQKKENRIFDFGFRHFVPFVFVIALSAAWYFYVDYYIHTHRGHFSHHGIWPVWNMTDEQYVRIMDALKKVYFKEMFLPYTQYLTFGIWVVLAGLIMKLKPVHRFFLLIPALGMFVELALWFQVLEGHDYYTINLLVVFSTVWAILFYQLRSWKYFNHWAIYAVGIVFFSWNAIACKHRIDERYKGWMNDFYQTRMKALTEIEPVFRELGINKEDKVISIPDETINGSLYYMNRKGYNNFGSDFNNRETFYKRIAQGAKYLVINDTTILQNEVVQPFIIKRLGTYSNIAIFDLRDIKVLEQ
jgi:hypothetical protein